MTTRDAARYRRRYEERKAAGLCVTCTDPSPLHVYCDACRAAGRFAHRAEQMIQRRAECRAAGICVRCLKCPARTGVLICQRCADRNRDNGRRLAADRKEATGHRKSAAQRSAAREWRKADYARRSSLGLCVNGGCNDKSLPDRTKCERHAKRRDEYSRRFRLRQKRAKQEAADAAARASQPQPTPSNEPDAF